MFHISRHFAAGTLLTDTAQIHCRTVLNYRYQSVKLGMLCDRLVLIGNKGNILSNKRNGTFDCGVALFCFAFSSFAWALPSTLCVCWFVDVLCISSTKCIKIIHWIIPLFLVKSVAFLNPSNKATMTMSLTSIEWHINKRKKNNMQKGQNEQRKKGARK